MNNITKLEPKQNSDVKKETKTNKKLELPNWDLLPPFTGVQRGEIK